MNTLATTTATLPISTDAALLGMGCLVLGVLYVLSQAQVSRHRWLRLLLGLLTLGLVLLALGWLFWPVNGLVFTLAAHSSLYSLFQSFLFLLSLLSLVMGSIGVGALLTHLSLIGWKLLSNSQGPTSLKLRSRWVFSPFAFLVPLVLAADSTGLLTSFESGLILLIGYQVYGGMSMLSPENLQWVDTLHRDGLRKTGYVLGLIGIVIMSMPYLVLL